MADVDSKNGHVKEAKPPKSRFKYVSKKEGNEILDRQARKYFGISGEEFARHYKDGTLTEEDNLAFDRVAMLIPLSEYQ
jgi:hypothetical protein